MHRIQSSRRLDGSNGALETGAPTPNPESQPNGRSSWLQTVLTPTAAEPIKGKNGTRNVILSNAQRKRSEPGAVYPPRKESVHWTQNHTNILQQILNPADSSESKGLYPKFKAACEAHGYLVPGDSVFYRKIKKLSDERCQQLKARSNWTSNHTNILQQILNTSDASDREGLYTKVKVACAAEGYEVPSQTSVYLKIKTLPDEQRQQLKVNVSWMPAHTGILNRISSSSSTSELSFKAFARECKREALNCPSPISFSRKLIALKQSQSKP